MQAHLRAQSPLPDTSDELCAVGKALKADATDIRLGASATERQVKQLSASGDLARYRILHFATHGVVAGEISGSADPGLILTPPATATDLDDGYLSAGEIANLKLDADWVILSACNTAAGGATQAEALSGLARSFFYAGARAVLVSHWAVESRATAKLVSAAATATADSAAVGRAEALRRAMQTMIEDGEPHEAHPSFWAPFVVVGEGAAR
jgi:CHAT domain-containing protein